MELTNEAGDFFIGLSTAESIISVTDGLTPNDLYRGIAKVGIGIGLAWLLDDYEILSPSVGAPLVGDGLRPYLGMAVEKLSGGRLTPNQVSSVQQSSGVAAPKIAPEQSTSPGQPGYVPPDASPNAKQALRDGRVKAAAALQAGANASPAMTAADFGTTLFTSAYAAGWTAWTDTPTTGAAPAPPPGATSPAALSGFYLGFVDHGRGAPNNAGAYAGTAPADTTVPAYPTRDLPAGSRDNVIQLQDGTELHIPVRAA